MINASAPFSTYIQRNARYALRVVQDAQYSLTSHQQALSFQSLEMALSHAPAWPHARDLLLALAPHLERLGRWRMGIHFLELGIQQSQNLEDSQGEMLLRYHSGLILQRMGQYDAARQQHERSAQLARQQADNVHLRRAWHRLAYCQRNLRQWDAAEVTLARAQNVQPPPMADEKGYACLVQGALALDRRQWQLARTQFQCCLDTWQESGDPYLSAISFINLGLAAQRLHLDSEAESNYRMAITLLRSENASHALAMTQVHLGGLLSENHKAAEALLHLRQAETRFRHLQDDFWLAMTLTNLARAYYHLEEWLLACSAAERSAELFARGNYLFRQLNVQVVQTGALAYLGHQQRAQALVNSGLSALSALDSDQIQQFMRDAFLHVQGLIDAKANGNVEVRDGV